MKGNPSILYQSIRKKVYLLIDTLLIKFLPKNIIQPEILHFDYQKMKIISSTISIETGSLMIEY